LQDISGFGCCRGHFSDSFLSQPDRLKQQLVVMVKEQLDQDWIWTLFVVLSAWPQARIQNFIYLSGNDKLDLEGENLVVGFNLLAACLGR